MEPTPAAPTRIRVYVVEDQSKILKNQLKLLEASSDLEIIGTALSGETALEDIRRLKPDVVLLDLGLPRMSGIDVTRAGALVKVLGNGEFPFKAHVKANAFSAGAKEKIEKAGGSVLVAQ